jgi:hypothetical protein
LAASVRHHRHTYRGGRVGGARDQNGDIFLYAEHRLPHAEPAENACAIIQQGDWIPGVVHAPSLKGSLAEKNNVTQLYREKGLRVHTARMGEEPGFYHLLQLLKAQKLKVFGSLNGFLSEYRTGDESALLLQCCYVLLASGRQYMRPKVAPQLVDSRSSVHWGERDWMA